MINESNFKKDKDSNDLLEDKKEKACERFGKMIIKNIKDRSISVYENYKNYKPSEGAKLNLMKKKNYKFNARHAGVYH